MSPKQPNWVTIKKRYLQGEKPKDIAVDFGLTSKQISDKATRDQWKRKKTQISVKVEEIVKDEVLVTSKQVIVELARIAFCDATQIYEPNSNGEGFSLKSLDQIPLELRRCIKTIEQRPIVTKEDGYIGNAITKVSFYDKVKANELLGKHLGIWKEEQKLPSNTTKETGSDPLADAFAHSATTDWTEADAETAPSQEE